VASVLCHTYPCPAESENKFYDPKKSKTQEAFTGTGLTRDPGADIDIMFGTGELRGPLHVDTYRVGPLKVKKQPFAMIREMTGEVFSAFPFEGILGLAFKSLSFGGIEPFFERVIQQRLLEHNEFAFYLNVDSQKPSALLWGGIDQSLYEGPLHMFPVVQAHYWALELVDLRLGKESLLANSDGARVRRVIVDSGTTYFTAPSELYDRIMDSVPEAPCSEVESYKPLTYVLRGSDGKTYDLEVTQETYMVGARGGDECRPSFMRLDMRLLACPTRSATRASSASRWRARLRCVARAIAASARTTPPAASSGAKIPLTRAARRRSTSTGAARRPLMSASRAAASRYRRASWTSRRSSWRPTRISGRRAPIVPRP
jgi:hypothetical protein